ncbi:MULTISPECIES: anti-adapter protein IraP [Trabulsiella]|uniref:YaiB family cytoplasmic protein n=1 Tax=Trabulsiella guamensis ATCC 49490 TaxID=1005994 RepID=A0A085AE26_9ENTR|nr:MULTISPECIES: anti-adapter protein IraP [Trabulsiella]KFC08471.1 YaiB family cytoplasmic protein [Trabulsiella guamensis ATCC 49490]
MKNLIAELLVKLAEKEEEAKELTAQVEALEIVVTALIRHMEKNQFEALVTDVESALDQADPRAYVSERDTEILRQYLNKLLRHPRS